MAQHTPLILTDPGIKISTTADVADLTELACDASHVELTPDTAITTVDTFCGSRDYPGITKWSLVATLVQSFDTDATEEVLSAAVALGTDVPFELVPYKSQPVSASNPSWSGTVRPAPYSPINGDAGDVSTVDLEWAVTSGPFKSIVPGGAAAALSETEAELAAA
jgi:hypothetical protein